jgi:antitoxin (DNA-binding transcriptional repressor) of toxin-antitoxin stability system
VITKHGKPTARLVGVRVQPCGDEIIDEFAAFREGRRLGFSVADAIAEGRL